MTGWEILMVLVGVSVLWSLLVLGFLNSLISEDDWAHIFRQWEEWSSDYWKMREEPTYRPQPGPETPKQGKPDDLDEEDVGRMRKRYTRLANKGEKEVDAYYSALVHFLERPQSRATARAYVKAWDALYDIHFNPSKRYIDYARSVVAGPGPSGPNGPTGPSGPTRSTRSTRSTQGKSTKESKVHVGTPENTSPVKGPSVTH